MDPKRLDHLGSFQARNNAGQEFTIDILQAITLVRSRGGIEEVRGLKELQSGGVHVNRIDKGRYKLGEMELRSDDPNAP
jgi:hypothetical protein